MAYDTTKMQLGTCDVFFKGQHLGHTKGGVEVTYEPEYHDVTVDRYGNSVVEKRLLGEKMMVKFALAQFTIESLEAAAPMATVDGNTDGRIEFGKRVGAKLSEQAGLLVLHPVDQADNSFDVVLHKAAVHSQILLPFKNDEDRIIEIEFYALVDESKENGNYLGLIGDTTD